MKHSGEIGSYVPFFFTTQAFVHDPLINWRLFNFNEVPQMHVHPVVNSDESAPNRELQQPLRGVRERELLQVAYNIA